MSKIVFALLFLLYSVQAFSEVSLPAEYRADEIVDGKIRRVTYVSGNSLRAEYLGECAIDEQRSCISISNPKKKITYDLYANKEYVESSYAGDVVNVGAFTFAFEDARENEKYKLSRLVQEGTEVVDGQLCDIYRNKSLTAYRGGIIFWVSRQYGIPIQTVFILENLLTHKLSESKHELLIRPGAQAKKLFELPSGYVKKVFANISSIAWEDSEDNKFLRSNGHMIEPKKFHTALCMDQTLHPIRYVDSHSSAPQQFREVDEFDRYRFINKTEIRRDDCLIGDDAFFRQRTLVKLSNNDFVSDDTPRPLCSANAKKSFVKFKGLAVEGCWQLATFGKNGFVNLVKFVPHNGTVTTALAWSDKSRLILNESTVEFKSGDTDVWSLGDEGVFQPSNYKVLFAFQMKGEIELVSSRFGGEGVTYFTHLSQGNVFVEQQNESVYTNGY